MTTGYCPHAGAKDDTKRKQESRELYFIAPLQGPKYNNTLGNPDSCRKGTTLFVSGYYYWQDLPSESASYIEVINISFAKIAKEDPATSRTVISSSPGVKRRRDTKIPNASAISDQTPSSKKPAHKTTPPYLTPRAPVTPSSLRYQPVNPSSSQSPGQLGRSAGRSRGGSMLAGPSTIATGQPQTQYRPLDPIDPLDLTYNNPRAIFPTIDGAFMSGGSGGESVITVDDDYDHTDPFMVQDVDSDGAVARQLHEQLEAPGRRGSTRVRVPSAKVREHQQDKELSGDEGWE
jgi:hypothetical protein